jgi:DEAD/DEAH box helicase domain-containing protein
LDNVAGATLGTQKSADGLQAIRWFRQGNMTDLLAYCRQDVVVTYQLYTFGHENGYVAYVDRFHRQHRVRVDW